MDFIHSDRQRRLGYMLAFGALIWAGTYNALAKGLTPYLSPMTLLLISETLTALFIVATFGLVPLLRRLTKMNMKTLRICILVGLINSVAGPLLFFTGLKYTSAVNATMLSTAEIVSTLVLSHFILSERMGRMQITGMATIIAGIFVINIAEMGDSLSVHMGDAFILLGCSLWGLGSVIFKKYLSHEMPELTILIRNVTGIVCVMVLSLFVTHSITEEVVSFPMSKVLLLLSFTFFARYLNLTFFYEALDRISASSLSLIQIATPLVGVLFAYLILGETIKSYHVVGGAFMVVGLMIEQMSPQSLKLFRARKGLPFLSFHHHITPIQTMKVLPKNI